MFFSINYKPTFLLVLFVFFFSCTTVSPEKRFRQVRGLNSIRATLDFMVELKRGAIRDRSNLHEKKMWFDKCKANIEIILKRKFSNLSIFELIALLSETRGDNLSNNYKFLKNPLPVKNSVSMHGYVKSQPGSNSLSYDYQNERKILAAKTIKERQKRYGTTSFLSKIKKDYQIKGPKEQFKIYLCKKYQGEYNILFIPFGQKAFNSSKMLDPDQFEAPLEAIDILENDNSIRGLNKQGYQSFSRLVKEDPSYFDNFYVIHVYSFFEEHRTQWMLRSSEYFQWLSFDFTVPKGYPDISINWGGQYYGYLRPSGNLANDYTGVSVWDGITYLEIFSD